MYQPGIQPTYRADRSGGNSTNQRHRTVRVDREHAAIDVRAHCARAVHPGPDSGFSPDIRVGLGSHAASDVGATCTDPASATTAAYISAGSAVRAKGVCDVCAGFDFSAHAVRAPAYGCANCFVCAAWSPAAASPIDDASYMEPI